MRAVLSYLSERLNGSQYLIVVLCYAVFIHEYENIYISINE